jgi:hypothetical protein
MCNSYYYMKKDIHKKFLFRKKIIFGLNLIERLEESTTIFKIRIITIEQEI